MPRPSKSPDQPLSDDEFARLAAFLASRKTLGSLRIEGLYLPVALDLESDTQRQDQLWAEGFMRGVNMRRPLWAPLIQDENEGGAIITIALLAGEIEPEWRTRPRTLEQQNEHLQHMCAGMVRMHRYFRRERVATARNEREVSTVRRDSPKVGRNEPCPCGSGRKFKHCCGAAVRTDFLQ
jgi:uncharacterized protein